MREEKQRRRWVWWLALILVCGGAAGGYAYYRNASATPAPYRAAPVTRGDVTEVVTATGQLNAVTNVEVGSQISGIIEKIYVDFNSKVKAGQVVAQIDPSTYKANVLQAEGDLANSNAKLELTQVNFKRSKQLRAEQLISESDYDQAVADLHQAQADVQVKQAALDRAKVDLDRTTIYSPIDGIVISRNVDVGQTVAASLAAPTLFLIDNDLSKMQIDAMVSEADIGGVAVGQKVDFTVDAFPYNTFHGQVMQVRNAAVTNQNVITYDTVINVSNPDLKLKPGMTANVSIIIAQRRNVLKIANSALRFHPPELALANPGAASPSGFGGARPNGAGAVGAAPAGGRPRGRGPPGSQRGGAAQGRTGARRGQEPGIHKTVYVAASAGDKQTIQPRSIEAGISDGISTEIVSGLSEGEQVVIGLNFAAGNQSRMNNPFFRRRF